MKTYALKSLFLLGFLFVLGMGWAIYQPSSLLSDHPFLKELFEKHEKYNQITAEEMVYLHYDKTLYRAGETIWFQCYIRNSGRLYSEFLSDIVYVEFINPAGAIEKSVVLIAKEGRVSGDISIPGQSKGGKYKLKAYTLWQKNTNCSFEREITIHEPILPHLLLDLNFEKKSYLPGTIVNASLYLESLENQALQNQEATYSLVVEGKELYKKTIKTNTLGAYLISFTLPENATAQNTLLQVLVPYKGMTESIAKNVPVSGKKIDLQFFPEGGQLIANLKNKVAFKAINEIGLAADFTAEIYEKGGSFIQEIQSYHMGMGSFTFTPKKGKTYVAKIKNLAATEIKLPEVQTEAISLAVRGNNKTEIQTDILSDYSTEAFVVVKSNDKIRFSQAIQLIPGVNPLRIPSSDFPIGIVQITVFDAQKQPRSERLVFVNPHKKIQVKIKPSKEKYLPREKVKVQVQIHNERGEAVEMPFSVSVTDKKLLRFAQDKQGQILSYLLLESPLKGYIEEPNFYFDSEDNPGREKPQTDRSLALDHLMLTQGWRKFTWKQLSENAKTSPAYSKEKAVFAGKVVDVNGKNLPHVEIQINGKSYGQSKADGSFSVAYTNLYQPVELSASLDQMYSENQTLSEYNDKIQLRLFKAKKYAGVLLNKGKEPLPFSKITVWAQGKTYVFSTDDKGNFDIKFPENADYIQFDYLGYQSKIIQSKEILSNSKAEVVLELEQIQLEEVQIVSKNIRNRMKGENIPAMADNGVAFQNDVVFKDKVVAQEKEIEKLEQKKEKSAGKIDKEEINLMPFNLEDLKMGAPVPNLKEDQKIQKVNSCRYYLSKSFYVPSYKTNVISPVREDFRSTIFWNPNLKTNAQGKAEFEFFTSDEMTSFQIILEGIGQEGTPVHAEEDLFIQLPLAIDAKIPTELLSDDWVSIPVTISNNTEQMISGNLACELPAFLQMKEASSQNIQIEPLSAKTIYITAQTKHSTEQGTILLSFQSKEGLVDKMKTTIKVRSRGFPVRRVISNDALEAQYDLNFMNPIEGSVEVRAKIIPNTLDQVLNGLDQMLRMPSGCFEQTSSTNYPNILALQYMKETNTLNPSIAQNCKQFLEVGYSRLLGYESNGGGFDWWGRDPAHEALTAYGLMQFVEMSEVFEVDPNLITRTQKWLLERRDGKGSWKKNPTCLHSWASSEITDAYIVWALSESKLENSILKEVNYSYNMALESKDPYTMALVANTLLNLNDNRAIPLVEQLSTFQKSDGSFQGNTVSVVNSTGAALQIETTALAALAFMKSGLFKLENKKACEFLQKGKNYFGYGSTQGTVLALKALLEYAKNSKKTAEAGSCTFWLDDKKIFSLEYKADQKTFEIPDLSSYFKNGKQKLKVVFEKCSNALPYEIELSYHARVPANSTQCDMLIQTKMNQKSIRLGENIRMETKLTNQSSKSQPIVMAMIGIPAGLSLRLEQLKDLKNQGYFDYYEIFQGYLVLHFEHFKANEIKNIAFDLKADIPGSYESPASSIFLYYSQEYRQWDEPQLVQIVP